MAGRRAENSESAETSNSIFVFANTFFARDIRFSMVGAYKSSGDFISAEATQDIEHQCDLRFLGQARSN